MTISWVKVVMSVQDSPGPSSYYNTWLPSAGRANPSAWGRGWPGICLQAWARIINGWNLMSNYSINSFNPINCVILDW